METRASGCVCQCRLGFVTAGRIRVRTDEALQVDERLFGLGRGVDDRRLVAAQDLE
jgi:hypothetical protein